jgi:hypothetical protein
MINVISSSLIAVVLTLVTPQQATYFIGGQVQDNAGKAVCGVRVCALAAGFDPKKPNVFIPCAVSDERGQFTIAVNKTSTYKLVYDASAQGFQSTYLPFFRHPSVPLPEVVVDNEQVRTPITITLLPKNGLLTGKAVDAKTGLPVDTMEFMLCHATYPLICRTVNSKGSSGYFKIATPQVPFTFRIKAPGFDDWLGLNGDKDTPISVAPETKAQFSVFLKRSEATGEKALNESEKQVGVNLSAPVQLSPANNVVFDRYPRTTKIEWSPVEGAVSYSVEVDYCDGAYINRSKCVNPQPNVITTNPPTSGIVTTTYEFDFVGAQPGRWRVWAVDKYGREGFKSPWRRFIYLQ